MCRLPQVGQRVPHLRRILDGLVMLKLKLRAADKASRKGSRLHTESCLAKLQPPLILASTRLILRTGIETSHELLLRRPRPYVAVIGKTRQRNLVNTSEWRSEAQLP